MLSALGTVLTWVAVVAAGLLIVGTVAYLVFLTCVVAL